MAFSIIGHLIFYAVVIKLDQWTYRLMVEQGRLKDFGDGEVAHIVELAPPGEAIARLRLPPEAMSRVDITRFRFEQSRADDQQLVATSPRPSGQPAAPRTNSAPMSSKERPMSVAETSPPSSNARPEGGSSASAQPSVGGAKPPIQPLISPGQPMPRPGGTTATPLRASEEIGPVSKGREDGSSPGEFGLQAAQSQYIAYVRAKIYRVNERFMPRGWVETMLTRKVSADFEIGLVRGGRLSSMRLVRSCGYSTLDDIARQAINTASPFEGWPPEAGDALNLTVTVYYTPYR
jgi:hypothetical protein